MPRTMTLEEALEEFDNELQRIEDFTQQLQDNYDSGRWVLPQPQAITYPL